MISVEHIHKAYDRGMFSREKNLAVHDVSFCIDRGETFGILGESGCGKSTVAKILTGMLRPDSGRILFNGSDILATPGWYHANAGKIQMILQNPQEGFDPEMTLQESLLEPLLIRKQQTRQQCVEKAAALMERLNLPVSLWERYPHQISGGEAQRLSIIRALLQDPEILVLDEPTSMLDVSTQAQILNILLDIQRERGLSYLFISHDPNVMRQMCHAIGIMRAGVLLETGRTEELFASPREEFSRRILFSWHR